jgi:hypothetical protein
MFVLGINKNEAMKTYEKDNNLIPNSKSGKKSIYDKIHNDILKKRRVKDREREELISLLNPTPSNKIKDFANKCRVGYYGMLYI